MKKIKLSQGKYALVDDEDFDGLSKVKWCVCKSPSGKFYAVRSIIKPDGEKTNARMHRVIMNPPEGMEVDHRDGDGLNNRRKNLRICTNAENRRNRGKHSNNTSGYKGVNWHKRDKKWQAKIKVNGKILFLGYFTNKCPAHKAYIIACKKHHGNYANYK